MSYVIANIAGAKSFKLLQIKQSKGVKHKAVVPDASVYSAPEYYTISDRDIVCTLGDKPPYGNAYGVLVEPIEKRILVPKWGDVFYYREVSDNLQSRIEKALRYVLNFMKERHLDAWHPLHTEIRTNKGRHLGLYKYRPKADSDTLVLMPPEGISSRELVALVAHEIGHGIWYRVMTATERSAWIQYYKDYTKVTSITQTEIKSHLREIRKLGSLKDYLKDCEPTEVISFNLYLAWLGKVFNMSKVNMQDLMAEGMMPPIPDTHLHKSDINTPLTLYAKTNPEELFAEAISMYVVKALADKQLIKLIKQLS